MELLYTILSVFLIIIGILMVVLILMQKTKGAEIGAVFGSGAAAAVLGAGATTFLTKLTYWLGGIFFSIVLILSLINHHITKPVVQDINETVPEQTKKVPAKEQK